MRTIYIKPNTFECYVTNDGMMLEVQTDYFDGKCDAYIEGYRFIPKGETWTRSDGLVFHGEMIAPWKPYPELEAAQAEYEKEQRIAALEDKNAALASENAMLTAQVSALANQMDFYEDCIVEMAAVVYA